MFAPVSDGRTRDSVSCVFIHSVEVQSVGGSTNGYPIIHNSLIFVVDFFLWSSLFAPSVSVLTYSLSLFVFCVRVLQLVTYAAAALHFSWPSS